MGLGNVLVLAQATTFLISFIVSFFLFVPITVSVNDSDGHCLLYTTGKWLYSNATGRELSDVKWGPDSACGFGVFMGVIVMLLSLFYIIWESIYLYKDTDSSWLDAFITAIVCLVGCLMLFASSLTLSVGFQKWCHLLTRPESNIEQCEDGQFVQIKFKDYTLNTSNYFAMMNMAQFGSWMTWLCWTVLSVIAVVKVYRYHRQEAFYISMNRERQRLLQRVGHSQPVVT